MFTFVHWLIHEAPKLRKNRDFLLEIGELPLEKWQRKTHEGLTGFGSNKFGHKIILSGFVKELSQIVPKVRAAKVNYEPITMLELGFGGGELGRQVIKKVPNIPIVYIGIDISPASIEAARQEFMPLHDTGEIIFKELSIINDETINSLKREAKDTSKNIIATWCGDFLNLDKYLSKGKVDIIFHARVFHHLISAEKARLVALCQQLSPLTIEMDDCNSPLMIFWAVIGPWLISPNIALLNGGIFSCLRDPSKDELTGYFKFARPFSYIRLIFGQFTPPQYPQWEITREVFIKGFSYRS
ncbi:class I SAM-dependent methyltransferase [Chloroflexota bacterium]